ncbi:MAG: GEVED domain-containing protein [Planctomycetota bacterium]
MTARSFFRRMTLGARRVVSPSSLSPQWRRLHLEPLEDRRLLAVDFGDAPDLAPGTAAGDYNTLSTDSGPSHTITASLYMGGSPDAEAEAWQSALADGDDTNGSDDEDGLNNPAAQLTLTVGSVPFVDVSVTNNTGAEATLYGWIDFDGSGVFDNATERASVAVADGTSGHTATLVFPKVPEVYAADTFARFRLGLSSDTAAADPTGAAGDGEVEDYPVAITARGDGSVKSHQKISSTEGGFTGTLDDYARFGSSLVALGDLDGDGVTELAVGAPLDGDGGSYRGAVWVLFMNADGTVKAHQKISDTEGNFSGTLDDSDYFGTSVAALGDLDSDGVTELAVGAYGDADGGSYRGAVLVLFLNADGTVKAHQKISDTEGGFTGTLDNSDNFGFSLATLGDLDGDGVSELAVGAMGDDDGGNQRGAVWVLFLNDDGTVKLHRKISDTEGRFAGTLDDYDYFGYSVAALGDLDGDGVTDLAVGAYSDADGGSYRGAVWVLQLTGERDLGDAPAQYNTLTSDDGAAHLVGDLFLGAGVDVDFDGQPSPQADGDDTDSDGDDEDGVVFLNPLTRSSSPVLQQVQGSVVFGAISGGKV